MPPRVAVLVKGYPRLSETFVVRELLGLEARGLDLVVVSLRRPTDHVVHDLHERVAAPVLYLPEYLHAEPRRVLRALWGLLARPQAGATLRSWLRDLARDPSRSRLRRLGQAAVLAAELPAGTRALYSHFIHTPTSVARYAARLTSLPFAVSAHAKDIWTLPAWEKAEKLADAAFTVTCTAQNHAHLRELAPAASVDLLYHGVDLARFAPDHRRPDTGTFASLSIARAVPKKGLDTLLAALAALPPDLPWTHRHVGDGPLLGALRAEAEALGLAARVTFTGPLPQLAVVGELRRAQALILPARVTADGDRDGLPNVLLEAMAMGLPVVTTPVSAIPEAVRDGIEGLLVPPDDAPALTAALLRLATVPALRRQLGQAARARVVAEFAEGAGLDRLARQLKVLAGVPLPTAGVAPSVRVAA